MTVDAFTILHVHVVLVHVPGSADSCGGSVTVLTTLVRFVCPTLVNVKVSFTVWPGKALHGCGVGVRVGVGVCIGAQTRRLQFVSCPGRSVAEVSTRKVHVPCALCPLNVERLPSGMWGTPSLHEVTAVRSVPALSSRPRKKRSFPLQR